MGIKRKLDGLKSFFNDKKVIVAFSGGADSTLLALVARDEAKDVLAVTVDNGVMPAEFTHKAEQIAKKIGIKHHTITNNFLKDSEFEINPSNRCYICKNKIYQQLEEMASDFHYDFVTDGTNITDLLEDRPGIMVNIEKNIKTPLVKYGFTSQEVRTILNDMNVEYHPSTTCLATRIPTGVMITPEKIKRINDAEDLVSNLTGLDVVRVRDNEKIALIEVEDIDKLIDKTILTRLDSELKAAGFKKVTMNIAGNRDTEKEIFVYKPCKNEKNRMMLETQLPYKLNIPETCHELETLGEVKCSPKRGIAMLEIDEGNITLSENGKIVVQRVKHREDAKNLLIRVLPCIRRQK